MFFSFARADDALAAAIDAQRGLATADWGAGLEPVKVRMALHTGTAQRALGTWLGVAVHHAARACAAGHGGQVLLTQATRDALRGDPPVPVRLLGEYQLRDIQGGQHLYQVDIPGSATDFPQLRTPSARVTNLPDQTTTFVGRAEEMADLRRTIGESRLVTICGPGGAGKTRLALEAAGDAGPLFDQGVWLIELADVARGSEVMAAAARALGVAEADVVDHLAHREALLVVDNCEHVVAEAAAAIATLLSSCPSVKVLATSREVLGLPGERRWPIPPLRMPDDAVRLFVDRAIAARPNFELDEAGTRVVETICTRLDAMPLAIELAAARTTILTPEQILAHLEDRFRLLAAAGAAHHRQQTLRAVIDWSYDLLNPAEQRALRRISVFPNTFDLDAAAAVIADDALDLVDSLVRKSIVTVGFDGAGAPARFWLLETVRAYAAGALTDAAEGAAARDLHARFFFDLAVRGSARLHGADQVQWLDRFEDEVDNVRAAVEWLLLTAPDDALTLAGLIAPFFGIRSRFTEGRALLEGVLEATTPEPSMHRLRSLVGAGTIARMQGDLPAARRHHVEQLEVARTLGSDDEIARALSSLGNVTLLEGDRARARALFEESLAIRRTIGSPRAIALSLNNLGVVADHEGDYERARAYFEEQLSIMRSLGDRRVAAQTLGNLAIVAVATGKLDEAIALLDEGISGFRDVGDTRGAAVSLGHRANAERRRGNLTEALHAASDALRVLDEIGDPMGVGMCLEIIAAVVAVDERCGLADKRAAAELLGRASTAPGGGAEMGSALAGTASEAAGTLRSALGDEAFAAAFSDGADLGLTGASQAAAGAVGATLNL